MNVDAIVEGTVLRSGGHVRITAQLIHASTDHHLWAESYDRELKDVLALQNDVARAIANEIRITLTPQEETRLLGTRPVTPRLSRLISKVAITGTSELHKELGRLRTTFSRQ